MRLFFTGISKITSHFGSERNSSGRRGRLGQDRGPLEQLLRRRRHGLVPRRSLGINFNNELFLKARPFKNENL